MSLTRILGYVAQLDDPHQGLYARNDRQKWEELRVFLGMLAADEAKDTAAPAAVPQEPAHSDDVAVDRFAAAMKEKLLQARAKGREGWEECHPLELSFMLRDHVDKGDPRDVANFCMFLWNNGEGIRAAPTPPAAVQGAEEDAFVIQKLGDLLAGVCIALKGPELEMQRHSYHDIVDVAEKIKLELDLFRAQEGNTPPAAPAVEVDALWEKAIAEVEAGINLAEIKPNHIPGLFQILRSNVRNTRKKAIDAAMAKEKP